ncbi:MAG: isochorismatase family protein [Chloroflexota bacterium]
MTSFRHGVALIVTDVQNDFADPAGGLAVAGAAAIVPGLNAAIAAARAAGALVVYTQDWHPPHTPHFAQDGGPWPVHCVAGTWGADFHPALDVDGPVVRKGSEGEDGYSGFTMRDHLTGNEVPTALHDLLRAAGAHTVVVAGIATDYCVRATVLDALRLGYAVTLRTDLVAAVDVRPGDGDAAIAEMVAAGARAADG